MSDELCDPTGLRFVILAEREWECTECGYQQHGTMNPTCVTCRGKGIVRTGVFQLLETAHAPARLWRRADAESEVRKKPWASLQLMAIDLDEGYRMGIPESDEDREARAERNILKWSAELSRLRRKRGARVGEI